MFSCVNGVGIWIHGYIDGYSRFVIYLEARLNKLSETVRGILREKSTNWDGQVGVGVTVARSIHKYQYVCVCVF